MGLVSGETGRGTFVRETSLPRGLGIDQDAAASGMVDLNFNYPSLPGQAELLRVGLRQLAAAGDLKPCCDTNRTEGASTSGRPWLAISHPVV